MGFLVFCFLVIWCNIWSFDFLFIWSFGFGLMDQLEKLVLLIAIHIHKLYNAANTSLNWSSLNQDQILTTRQSYFLISNSNKNKVRLNILPNRFSVLNGLIPLSCLNCTIGTFKIHMKKLFLST